jgi:hypothetical protein
MKAPATLMWNKAKTLLVPVGDPEGRFFAYAEGADIPEDSPLKVMPPAKNKMAEAPMRKSAAEGKEKLDG